MKRLLIAGALALACIPACAKDIIIGPDLGLVNVPPLVFVQYLRENAKLAPYRIMFRGPCGSACTVRLGLPHKCSLPGAEWWFHQASNADGSRNELVTGFMLGALPPLLQQYIAQKGGLTEQKLILTRDGAARSGLVPYC